MQNLYYLEATVDVADLAEASELIAGLVKRGVLRGGSAVVDQKVAAAAAHEAATAARNEDTLAASLDEYVHGMPLATNVDREQVLLRSRELIARPMVDALASGRL